MAVAFVRSHTGFSEKVSDTTATVTISTATTAGDLLVVAILFDNTATANKPVVSSITTMAGETNSWVLLGASRCPTAGSAGGFSSGELWAIKTTVPWSVASYTATLDAAVTMKATVVLEFSGAEASIRGGNIAGTGYSTITTAATATTVGGVTAGDLVVGFLFTSNQATAPSGDTDTTNGTWSTAVPIGSTGSTAASNNFGIVQYKIPTVAANQTYNTPSAMTAGNGVVVCQLLPTPDPAITQAAYRFYADGTETGTLVDIYAETNVDEFRAPTSASYLAGQSFLGNGGSLVRAGFWLNKIGAPTGNMWAEIRAHTGTYGANGVGTGTVLATSATRVQSTLQTTAQWEDFIFDGTFTLANGTPYVVVLAIDTWVSGNTYQMGDDGISTHSGNRVTYNGTTWTPVTQDAAFRVYTDGGLAVPLAAQDTAYTADVTAGDVNLQLRTRLQSTNVATLPGTDDFQLQWEKNANGTWTAVSAQAGVLADSYAVTAGMVGTLLTDPFDAMIAQSFLGDGRRLTGAAFNMTKFGSPVGTVVARLYAHTGTFGSTSVPTGAPLATSAAVNAAGILSGLQTFLFDGAFTLANGTPYCIAVAPSSTSDAGNCVAANNNSAGGHAGNMGEFNSTSGTWGAVAGNDVLFQVYTSVDPVTGFDATVLAEGQPTTNRLGAGTGSFVAGKVSEDGLVDDLGWTGNNYTEVLYALKLRQLNLANADTLRFRVLRNGVTTGLTYTATPTANVTKSAAALPPRNIHLPNPMISPSFIR